MSDLRPMPKPPKRRRMPEFLAWLHSSGRPCVFSPGVAYEGKRGGRVFSVCSGPLEANHLGARGLGQKSHDDESAIFCRLHHRDWTDLCGPFSPSLMSREERRAWADERITETQAAYHAFVEAAEVVA